MSNRPNHFTVEFHEGDAPMLVHAMSIAACTAMMCGHKGAQERFRAYQKQFEPFVPAISKLFDEEQWAEIIMALQKVDRFELEFQPRYDRWWKKDEPDPTEEGYLTVVIGERRFTAKGWNLKRDEKLCRKHIEETMLTLNRLAPMDCTGTVTEVPAKKDPIYG